MKRFSLHGGYSFVELLVVTTIVLILASAVQPLARVTIQRQKEVELRRVLREMRNAIDRFKDAADQGLIPPTEQRRLPAGTRHPGGGRLGGERCVGPQAQVPAAYSHRPDDR
jgi:prepilin-type N-terminal cleavage/methylation domain-containing protein